MNFGFPFTPFQTPGMTSENVVEGAYTGKDPMPNMMPASGTGCGCPCKGMPQTVCNQVVNKCFVEDCPYYVNYHTHCVNNVVRRHIQIPTYSTSEETVYYDEWQTSCPGKQKGFF